MYLNDSGWLINISSFQLYFPLLANLMSFNIVSCGKIAVILSNAVGTFSTLY